MGGARPDLQARRQAEDDPAGVFAHGGVVPGAPTRCPNCGQPGPEAVTDGCGRINFLCHRCGTCIHIGLGYVWVVDPRSCPGCACRPLCLSVPTWLAESLSEVRHLTDGTRVSIRPPLPSDGVEVDYRDHFAWEAFALDEAGQPGVGMAQFARLPHDPRSAEASVSVVEAHRGHGLGTMLMAMLVGAALDRGVRRFVGFVPEGGPARQEGLRALGGRVDRGPSGAVRVEFELPESEAAAATLAHRALGVLARRGQPEG